VRVISPASTTGAPSVIDSHDPPGGSTSWNYIIWDEHDLRGTSTPVRYGNNDLGYVHYSGPHNLYSYNAIHAAFQTHNPDKASGAHLEYISLAVDPSNGSIHLVVRVIVQAASRTDDGRYQVSDGRNIGVITAYCEGGNVCPAWVNNI
jgi:hypothetical protein